MRKKLLVLIFTLEVIIGGLALAYIFSAYWHKPLGPSLAMAIQPSELSNNSSGKALDDEILGFVPEPTPTSPSLLAQIATILKKPNESSKPLCGGPAVMTLLVIGSDERGNDYLYGLADSIRIVRIDFTVPGVMVLDIPAIYGWISLASPIIMGLPKESSTRHISLGTPVWDIMMAPVKDLACLLRHLTKIMG